MVSLSNEQVFLLLTFYTIYLIFHPSSSSFFKTAPFIFTAANNDQNEEADALIKWKLSLDNKSQHVLSSWLLGGGKSHCSWLGVSCDDEWKSITHLNLSSSGLNGTLQNLTFSCFTNLVSIDFAKNNLHGDIPLGLYSLSKLNHLDLADSHLSGFLSPVVGNLSHLSYIRLSGNYLFGTILKKIGLLRDLHEFRIGINGFSGSIPKEIGNLISLRLLNIDTNNLKGPIPTSIGNLTNLINLYLYKTNIFGHIPEEIGKLENLNNFDHHGNQLSRSIPVEIGNLSNLGALDHVPTISLVNFQHPWET
nr:probable leucine-rich repeat receptor-like protein kinase At1g35710 [Ziziphus jujuba var. spinosa]